MDWWIKNQKPAANLAFGMLLVNHIVGVWGLNHTGFSNTFENLSGVNLLLSFLLILAFQIPFNRQFLIFCTITFFIGMAAEITGVNIGIPFGAYHYTNKLGPMVAGVPVIIGLNWILLSYVCAMVTKRYFRNEWIIIFSASAFMVFIDLLLEGFATRHQFWLWQSGSPPAENFLAWFMISVPIQFLFRKLVPVSENPNAIRYLGVLLAFLITDLLFAQG